MFLVEPDAAKPDDSRKSGGEDGQLWGKDPSGLAPLVNKEGGDKPPKNDKKELIDFSPRLATDLSLLPRKAAGGEGVFEAAVLGGHRRGTPDANGLTDS